ncbi:MAG: O-antigen ligase family protein [Candidatus Omnitrophica bacterium]|nr:O-antigen ligase family protein [Candidatus Omnitrophota bacterium]
MSPKAKNSTVKTLNKIIEWSLYILLFSIPVSKTLIEICATLAIICWVIKRILLGREGLDGLRTDINLPIAVFYFISLLSIFWSTHPNISASAFVRKLSEYVILYFIVAEMACEKRIVRNLIAILAASAFLVCIDGLYQKAIGIDFIRGYSMFNLKRVTSCFKFPNGLSAWLLMVFFPFASLAFLYTTKRSSLTGDHKNHLLPKAINYILVALILYTLFFTYTRGAFISFAAGLTLFLFLISGKRFRVVFFSLAAVIILLILFLPKELKEPIGLSNIVSYGTSGKHRLRMWATAWRMFADRPFTGQGLNTFMANYEAFRGPHEEGIWYAHNCYLQMAAEIGVFGLLSFLWMIIKTAVVSIKSWRRINDEFLRFAYLGLFCGIMSFLFHSGMETSLYSLKLVVLFYFSLGLLMGIKKVGMQNGKV